MIGLKVLHHFLQCLIRVIGKRKILLRCPYLRCLNLPGQGYGRLKSIERFDRIPGVILHCNFKDELWFTTVLIGLKLFDNLVKG